jgi:heme-degrading monooxygenase HmoA
MPRPLPDGQTLVAVGRASLTNTRKRYKETDMIFELAQIDIKPGMESAFEKGVAQAAPLFQRARGCRGLQLLKGIEQPSRYTLMVTWETVEDHTVHFRQSADFQEWRRLVGECFLNPPQAVHVQVALRAF